IRAYCTRERRPHLSGGPAPGRLARRYLFFAPGLPGVKPGSSFCPLLSWPGVLPSTPLPTPSLALRRTPTVYVRTVLLPHSSTAFAVMVKTVPTPPESVMVIWLPAIVHL